ncbi:MAG: MotA/TolQ/ExbB proton channel family protein, partial [Ignavibacteriales bacterium]
MKSKSQLKGIFTGFAGIVIPVLFAVSVILYLFVMGNPQNFQGNNPANLPKPGNYLGIIYKGGIIVPVLMAILMMVITFSIERWITITKAKGKGRISAFVVRVYQKLSNPDIDGAIDECDRQRGSVANVIKAGLYKYKQMMTVKDMNKDQKIVSIKQEIEEATSLEMPILEQNLVILATIAPLATLMGLLGT